jgi:hypothetical protein
VHPSHKYWGKADPTRVMQHKVSKEEMVNRVNDMFAGHIRNQTCPKALSMYRPTEAVSHLASNRPSLLLMLLNIRHL